MKTRSTQQFKRQLNKIVKKSPQLKSKIIKQTTIFKKDPYYPSLKTHKLIGKRSDQFAFWVHDDVRIIFIREGEDVIFTQILTSHDQY